MGICWDITMSMLDMDCYPEGGRGYGGLLRMLRDSEVGPLQCVAVDALNYQLMEPYLDYWSQQTGGTYSLTMADA